MQCSSNVNFYLQSYDDALGALLILRKWWAKFIVHAPCVIIVPCGGRKKKKTFKAARVLLTCSLTD